MPLYHFKEKSKKKVWEAWMSSSEREAYLVANPNVEQVIHTVRIADPWHVRRPRPSDHMRDRMREIKRQAPKNNITVY